MSMIEVIQVRTFGVVLIPTIEYLKPWWSRISMGTLWPLQLYMATFFTRAVESINELRVTLSRLEEFLSLPEPPVLGNVQPEDTAAESPSATQKEAETLSNDASAVDAHDGGSHAEVHYKILCTAHKVKS